MLHPGSIENLVPEGSCSATPKMHTCAKGLGMSPLDRMGTLQPPTSSKKSLQRSRIFLSKNTPFPRTLDRSTHGQTRGHSYSQTDIISEGASHEEIEGSHRQPGAGRACRRGARRPEHQDE